ncbi:2-C-methyl-D-erythritol 4-phosphate cytidylyltransferase [Pontiella desulfatans]|uniref:2-C-methyl-D-erythritol 4-phosphate cytidylyltransferase n=1 Tax=Pontiella desulfatans TaxID=2750659 RepID=A0A6C2U4E3_PONDE|nr:2-C-methyl-D-erythritol 4-phosphate cytidylyltransferase [Pontiella desulfatans]VGO14384.1 2-C-methyl-D-erythritol 4-phosphate cytidylyltransferase [Pontiella desulfatans]
MNTMAIVVACGKEEEIAPGTEAAFLTLGDSPILAHSLKTLEEASVIDSVVVVVGKDRVDATIHVIKRFGCTKVRGVVVGGVNRLSTLRTVFSKIQTEPSVVVIHEASRPFLSKTVLAETIKGAKRYGCSIAAHKIPDATKYTPKGMRVSETLDRNTVWSAQTPQAFKADVLKKIIDPKTRGVKIVDDESEFVPDSSEVYMVEAGYANMKIRSKADLGIATALLNAHLTGNDSKPRAVSIAR